MCFIVPQEVIKQTKLHLALADSVYHVLGDVMKHDAEASKDAPGEHLPHTKRKIFVAGQSLGGFVAAQTCLKYGMAEGTGLVGEPEITGVGLSVLFLCASN